MTSPVDLAAIQERLAQTQGPAYWRSLEELAETPAFQDFLHREFPAQASEWLPNMSRRGFLRLMGAGLALAGLAACTPPQETIRPYVKAPEDAIPGQPLYFATAVELGGYGLGVLVESHEGRPTKIEGNPDHPASLGATDAFAQAAVLGLYDPDRSRQALHQAAPGTWEAFLADLAGQVDAWQANDGAGLRILTGTVTSPSLAGQIQAVLERFPNAVWHQYEPVNRDNVYAGAALAFGQPVEPIYRLDQAQVILSLDGDLFQALPGRVRYARDFAKGRPANRLYVVETTPTITGAAADHRLALSPEQIGRLLWALADALGLPVDAPALDGLPAAWVQALAQDLDAHRGAGLILAGDAQPPGVHALVHALNEHLGNAGQTVIYTDPVAVNPASHNESLGMLVADMQAGQVDALLILGGNPVYDAPADLAFSAGLEKVDFSVHLGLYADETGARCTWHIPAAHPLEAWGDVRAFDGTVTVQQPLIAPLYGGRTALEVLDALRTDPGESSPRTAWEIVHSYWQAQHTGADFDAFWQRTLHNGVMADTALPAQDMALQEGLLAQLPPPDATEPATGLTLVFRPDPAVWDGRFANNAWLQELPRPLTKLTWENAALLSPLTAQELGLQNGDLVEIRAGERSLTAPVWLLPGQTQDVVALHLGYGRSQAGRVGDGAGFNAYALRTGNGAWFLSGASLHKVGAGHPFAVTQDHHSMEGRDLIRVGTADQLAADPGFLHEEAGHDEISLYPARAYEGHAWGMVVDLGACIGCNACVVACQAENNIPVVGKEQVALGREMHWIRLDRYFEGDLADPRVHHQPVMCMHCEQAPCEVVCPVAATMHDSEGLNVMVYNRCVGTRYCSNNCPYKVRRFNFLAYTDFETETLKLQRNPDVTVRARGVMEKCTYCVQRISAARLQAKVEGRELVTDEVVTACQAACPTQAIVFGDLNDPQSQAAQRRASPLSYGLLTELGTRPRTTYLAKLRNPNPALEEVSGA